MALACAKLMPLLCDIATCSAKRSRSSPSPANDRTVRIALRPPQVILADGVRRREVCNPTRASSYSDQNPRVVDVMIGSYCSAQVSASLIQLMFKLHNADCPLCT